MLKAEEDGKSIKDLFKWAAVALFIVALIHHESVGPTTPDAQATPAALPPSVAMSVRFTGTQFVIRNLDSIACVNVKIEVNYEAFSSGYVLETPILDAHKAFRVGAMQFANSSGTRLNPFVTKPLRLMIFCDTIDGRISQEYAFN